MERPHTPSLEQQAPQVGLHTQPVVPPQVPSSVTTPVDHGGSAAVVVVCAAASRGESDRSTRICILKGLWVCDSCERDSSCVIARRIASTIITRWSEMDDESLSSIDSASQATIAVCGAKFHLIRAGRCKAIRLWAARAPQWYFSLLSGSL